jgi:hypothetical protein
MCWANAVLSLFGRRWNAIPSFKRLDGIARPARGWGPGSAGAWHDSDRKFKDIGVGNGLRACVTPQFTR